MPSLGLTTTTVLSSAAAASISLFLLKRYFNGGVCRNKARLDGKVVIITGANAGIGKETALALARRGATVVLACRDMAKGTQAAADIRRQLDSKCDVIVRQLDLSSLDSVRHFARQMNEELSEIHLLINNAGIAFAPYALTEDGFESTMGVNHLGHFLLTLLLLDKIKQSAPSRIINVASRSYEDSNLNPDNLMQSQDKFNAIMSYSNSKLANVLFTKELARRLHDSDVLCFSLHPGFVRTEIFRYFISQQGYISKTLLLLFSPLFWLVSKSCQRGAQTSIYCATEPTLDEKSSGCYFADCAPAKLKPFAEDMNVARRLWIESERFTMN